jgi:Family of unknown function (DUF5335)
MRLNEVGSPGAVIHYEEENMAGFIEQTQWRSFLDEFTKRNQFRATRLEVVGELGAQEEEEYLPLVGVSFEPKGTTAGSVAIILGGETSKDQRHVQHLIPEVQRIAPLIGETGFEEGLGFEDRDGGKTLLFLETLREIPEKTSTGH